ncbi:hypothetical protein, partial [Trebonia sp.]|uniref:hypothetical protein n=1 Tax=Trebonia sp. TaxID=2767075 RepID=UPI0026093B1C
NSRRISESASLQTSRKSGMLIHAAVSFSFLVTIKTIETAASHARLIGRLQCIDPVDITFRDDRERAAP